MKPLTVLIADDEENICVLVQLTIEAEGHTTACVTNARAAKEALAQQRFDLVVTDVLMPEGDGLDLITHLKKVQPDVRIVAMSGGGRYMEGVDCLKMARSLGAHAAVKKPFNRQQLLSAMELAMGAPGAGV